MLKAERPSPNPVPPATRLGTVRLNVAALDPMVAFYAETLGLKLHGREGQVARLGAGGEDLLELHELPAATRPRRSAGLYHFCLGVKERGVLGWLLKRLLEKQTQLQGLVDHHMAEAIYLPDPEGNGIELNWDRPRNAWDPQKMLTQGNGPLDVEGLLEEAKAFESLKALPPDTWLSHIHLHVAQLDDCEKFYVDTLGLDRMFGFPGAAVFTSAGGYHHHVAFNIWHGRGAPTPPEDSLGLRSFTLVLPDEASKKAALLRVQNAGYKTSAEGVKDPSGNHLVLIP
jgi:catechol 2,3-dioxygenase